MARLNTLFALLLTLIITACATVPGNGTVPAGPAVAAPAAPNVAASPSYQSWLASMEAEAIAAGISPAVVHNALDHASLNPRVVELDRKQPETTITFAAYAQRNLNAAKIEAGQQALADNDRVLTDVSQRYGVPAQIIVALWGMESSFGRNMGSSNIVDSLTTLAYEGRRAAFFRKELINALRVLERERVPASALRGSWAGAMGQCQFMPSTYLNYAVDYDGDGRVDIWNDTSDVFASIAHYLAAEGWKAGQGWGQEVRVDAAALDATDIGLDHARLVEEWAQLGVSHLDGTPLMTGFGTQVSLIMPDGAGGRSFLVTDNYRAIMRWNHSTYFATTVGLLANGIVQ